MGYKYKLKEVKVGDKEVRDEFLSTVTDIDSETGAITWDILQIPNLDKLLDESDDLVKTAKGVYVKAKGDKKFLEIYEDSRKLRNKIRTHIRNNYPEEYKKSRGVNEEDIDEMSTTGGGAGAASFTGGTGMQYATPYAFKKTKKKQKPIPENLNESKGAKNYFDDLKFNYQKAFRYLDADEKKEYQRLTKDYFSKLQEIKENLKEGIGASLGPGPKASEDGVKDNVYVKQFKYKLVPKKIKGSGLEVKQLFEDSDVKSFQQERISSFDVIEQEMNDIYKMLSNAKNETSDYYSENPGSFNVIKPTDLVLDYIKDIKDLLKGK